MDGLKLLDEAFAAGLEVWADGTQLVIRGPRSKQTVAERLLNRKASVLSALALPEEEREVVDWAKWLVERVPTDELVVEFFESPMTPVRLKLS